MRIPGYRTLKKIFFPFTPPSIGIVLMYHRVADLNYDPLHLNVSPGHLKEQMQVLKKYGRPVKMQDMGKNLKRSPIGEIDIAITLDDGYADNFYNAKPIFEQYEIPATFFIISGAVDSQEEFFWDGLKRTILEPETLPEILEITITDKKYRWEMSPSGPWLGHSSDYGKFISGLPSNDIKLSRFQLYSVILQILGPLSTKERQDILKQLAQWSGRDLTVRKDYLPMTSGELKSLSDCSLFEIGAHTVNHPQLANLPAQQQQKEISQSKIDIENKLDKIIVSFSYPHGSYNKETVKLVKHSKFQNACTVVPSPVEFKADPYLLPRFTVKDWNGDEFEQNLRDWLGKK